MSRAVKSVLGESLESAIVYLELNNIPWQVISRDGTPVRNTMEFMPGRLQLEVNNDVVSNVTIEK